MSCIFKHFRPLKMVANLGFKDGLFQENVPLIALASFRTADNPN